MLYTSVIFPPHCQPLSFTKLRTLSLPTCPPSLLKRRTSKKASQQVCKSKLAPIGQLVQLADNTMLYTSVIFPPHCQPLSFTKLRTPSLTSCPPLSFTKLHTPSLPTCPPLSFTKLRTLSLPLPNLSLLQNSARFHSPLVPLSRLQNSARIHSPPVLPLSSKETQQKKCGEKVATIFKPHFNFFLHKAVRL